MTGNEAADALANLTDAERAFIDLMKRSARLRARLREGVADEDKETFSTAARDLEAFLHFLLCAAGLLTVQYRLVEARAVLVAVELMIELLGDHDLIERMARRRDEYELYLVRAQTEIAALETDERQAVSKVLGRLAAQEIARMKSAEAGPR